MIPGYCDQTTRLHDKLWIYGTMGSETKEHLQGVRNQEFQSPKYWLKISTEHAAVINQSLLIS